MENKQIYFFIGTTAELIKLAPVIGELKKRKIDFKIISSNQNVLYFKEVPLVREQTAYFKNALKSYRSPLNNQYLDFIFWAMKTLGNFILYFNKELRNVSKKHAFFIVHGDTVSSLIGAVVAKINRTKLVHIESGLRSYNFFEPFPEELCRLIVSKLADIHFCPNLWAVNNLKNTGGVKINTENNTLIETLSAALKMKKNSDLEKRIAKRKFFILILHRQEHVLFKKNLAKGFLKIFTEYASRNLACVLILHNLTENFMKKEKLFDKIKNNENIILVPRLPYVEFIHLMKEAEFIATDGGSNQEEAYYMGKPCIILRNATERIEGLGENAVLSKYDDGIIGEFIKSYKKYKRSPAKANNPPSKIIVDYLTRH